MTIISYEYPQTVDIIIVSGRVTFTFWQVLQLLFTRKLIVSTKTYTAKHAGERLHTKVTWSWDR